MRMIRTARPAGVDERVVQTLLNVVDDPSLEVFGAVGEEKDPRRCLLDDRRMTDKAQPETVAGQWIGAPGARQSARSELHLRSDGRVRHELRIAIRPVGVVSIGFTRRRKSDGPHLEAPRPPG